MTVTAPDREQDEFLAVLCADEELLRAEFEAIIDASWDEPPPARPARPNRPSGQGPTRRRRAPRTVRMRSRHPETRVRGRQRSPPPWPVPGVKSGDTFP